MGRIATKNPWRCPCCGHRFPTNDKLKAHFREKQVCGDYAFDGLLAVAKVVHSSKADAYHDWLKSNPIKKFVDAL